MPDTFLSKDPVKALSEIRVQLYDRLDSCCDLLDNPRLRECRTEFNSGFKARLLEEVDWIRNTLDLIERS